IDRLCLEEALLNRREWNGTSHLRFDDGFRMDQTRQRGEFRNRLILKNVFASQLRTRAISTGDDLYAQNGITAEFAEVVVDTDLVESQHLSPDFSQHLFDLRAWLYVTVVVGALLGRFGRGQSTAVYLSVTRNRQRFEKDNRGWKHVGGQRL